MMVARMDGWMDNFLLQKAALSGPLMRAKSYWTDDTGVVEQASDWLCYTADYLVIVAYIIELREKYSK